MRIPAVAGVGVSRRWLSLSPIAPRMLVSYLRLSLMHRLWRSPVLFVRAWRGASEITDEHLVMAQHKSPTRQRNHNVWTCLTCRDRSRCAPRCAPRCGHDKTRPASQRYLALEKPYGSAAHLSPLFYSYPFLHLGQDSAPHPCWSFGGRLMPRRQVSKHGPISQPCPPHLPAAPCAHSRYPHQPSPIPCPLHPPQM